MESLTGLRLDLQRAADIGPERAGAVHFAKSIVLLAPCWERGTGSRSARRASWTTCGYLEARATAMAAICGPPDQPALQQPFESDWRGHRICGTCAPLMAEEPYAPRTKRASGAAAKPIQRVHVSAFKAAACRVAPTGD